MSSSCEPNLPGLKPVIFLEYRNINPEEASAQPNEPETAAPPAAPHASGALYTEEQMAEALAKARAEAANEALARARGEYEAKLANEQMTLAESVAQFKQERDDYYGRVEVELVQLALAIAGKILHREAQVDPMLLAALARVAAEDLQHRSTIVIRVRPEHCPMWREYFQVHLKGANVEVLEDSQLRESDCVMETDLGTADMSIDAQLKEIERGFFDLLAQRPGNR